MREDVSAWARSSSNEKAFLRRNSDIEIINNDKDLF